MTKLPPEVEARILKAIVQRESKMYGYYKSTFVDGYEGEYSQEYDNELLAVFAQELERRDGELREAIEGMKYSQPLLGTPETTERIMIAVNTTLDEVVGLLTPSSGTGGCCEKCYHDIENGVVFTLFHCEDCPCHKPNEK